MYKTAVMGDRDSIYGFGAVGIEVYPVDEANEGICILRKLSDEYAVIFITEKLASEMEAEIQKYSGRTVPAIIPIPGITGNTGLGLRNVIKSVEQAVGSDVLGE